LDTDGVAVPGRTVRSLRQRYEIYLEPEPFKIGQYIPYTPEEDAQILQSRNVAKLRFPVIARALGRNLASVHGRYSKLMGVSDPTYVPRHESMLPTEVAKIMELRKAGFTYDSIARSLGRSESTVRTKHLSVGGGLQGVGGGRYTPEEDAKLIAMKSNALSLTTIAKRLQRTVPSVHNRAGRLRDLGRLQRPGRKKSSEVASSEARKIKLEDEEKASGK